MRLLSGDQQSQILGIKLMLFGHLSQCHSGSRQGTARGLSYLIKSCVRKTDMTWLFHLISGIFVPFYAPIYSRLKR